MRFDRVGYPHATPGVRLPRIDLFLAREGERERTMPGRGCIGSNSCRATITVNTPSVRFVLSRRNFTRRSRDENCSPVLRKSAPPLAPRFEQLRIKAREKVASPRVEVKSVQSVCVYAWNLNICSSFSLRPRAINDGNLKLKKREGKMLVRLIALSFFAPMTRGISWAALERSIIE